MSIMVEELVEMIGILELEDRIENWNIKEDFKELREYTLEGLELEIEQGIVLATDLNDEIYKAFLVESIQNIIYKNKAEFTISFPDGKIHIKGLFIS